MNRKRLLSFLLLFVSLPLFLEFKLPDDFSWLKEFMPLTESLTVDHWEKDTRITFDEKGWVQVDKHSNPVTLSQYALVCFDTYRKTGDVKYKKAFLNQVGYLKDSSKYKVLGEDRIGYPYNYAFHDLKPDWYSGLAQAEAICVLIRYYSLTKDTQVLPLIKKLKNLMLWPMEDGGLLTKTPEGGLWIEEYPNSKQNKHVLNGFLISLFGLYEYTMLFPEDTKAKEIYQQCLASLKNSVSSYDTGSGLQYDRGTKSAASNWYMKAQVIEMKMLYSITNDLFFYRMHLLWSTYAYNKPLTFIGCKINDTNFSIPLKTGEDGWMKPTSDITNVAASYDIKQFSSGSILTNHGSNLLLDKNGASYFQPLSNDTMKNEAFAQYLFRASFKTDRLSLLNLNDRKDNYGIMIEYKSDTTEDWKNLKIKKTFSINKEDFYEFEEIQPVALKVKFYLKNNVVVMISEMNIQYTKKKTQAQYAHYQTEILAVDKKKLKFNFEQKNAGNYTVFYKFGNTKADLSKARWNANDCISKIPFESESCGSFYQFLIIFKLESESSSIKNVTVS